MSIRNPRGGSTAHRPPRQRPSLWVLLVAVVICLASLGNGFFTYGSGVGIRDDGTIIVEQRGPNSAYASKDGGVTWDRLHGGAYRGPSWGEKIRWGDAEVETPRGTYAIAAIPFDGSDVMLNFSITRTAGGQREVVYTPPHLQDPGAVRYRERWLSAHDEAPWRAPQNLVYHASSGNIVAVLGLEAVVTGDAAENWTPVKGHSVDVSLPSQMAFTLKGIWPAATVVAITVTAAVLALAKNGRVLITNSSRVGRNHSGLRYAGNYLLFRVGPVLVPLVIPAGLAAAIQAVETAFESAAAVAFIVAAALMLGAVAIWLKTRGVVGAWSLLLACITSAVGLAVIHTLGPSPGVPGYIGYFLYLLTFFLGFVWGIMALISFLPSYVRHLHIALAALLTIGGLIVLAFTIGVLQGFQLGAAKLYAIMLIIPAAWAFRRHLNGRIQKNETVR